jgi:hypothetical protein
MAGPLVEDLCVHKPRGYSSLTGVYTSSVVFKGDWQEELDKLPFYEVPKPFPEMEKVDVIKGQQSSYQHVAFRSRDGKAKTWNNSEDYDKFYEEEIPSQFKDTEAYDIAPKIGSIIDWFKCDKTRVRIFRQVPGHFNVLHTDYDNKRGQAHGQTLRILLQLSDMPGGSWFKFRTDDSEINMSLLKGQFVVFNTDTVAHQTENMTDINRDALVMVVKKNHWVENLQNNFDRLQWIDVDNLSTLRKAV